MLLNRKVQRCLVMCLRSCLVHGLDGSSRSKALSSQGQGAFFFSRVATRVMTNPLAPLGAKVPRAGNFVLRDEDGCSPSLLEEDILLEASPVKHQAESAFRSAARSPATFDRAEACAWQLRVPFIGVTRISSGLVQTQRLPSFIAIDCQST